MNNVKTEYTWTIYACYLGYITQAIVNNFAPLLFLRLMREYSISLPEITLVTTINFLVQLFVDLFSARYADRIGPRKFVQLAHLLAAMGLTGLAVFPKLFPTPYAGILAATVCYAIGGGIIEVMISPIVEACPTEKKEAAMSLLHSFYCWGHLGVVILSTLFFLTAGIDRWQILAVLWAVIPLANMVLFSWVPIYPIVKEDAKPIQGSLFGQQAFRILFLMMIMAGASEQAMSQWSSAFAESALHVSKTIGDLAGPSAFALFMGTARALYGKYSDQLPLLVAMKASAVLCMICYMLAAFSKAPWLGLLGCALCGFSVGIFWPGTFSTAALTLPGGGTAMYALLALAGDVGCSLGPTVTGMVSALSGGKLQAGLAAAILFPVCMLLGTMRMERGRRKP